VSSAKHPRAPGRALGAYPCARGFSLLEVLVAFVILALVGTALFRMFSGALANVGAADDYSRAVLVAESVLAEAAGVQPLREGTAAGTADNGRIAWTAQVTPYTPPQVNPDIEQASESMPTRLFRIVTEVTFPAANGNPRTFALTTIRIAVKESR
jgi:general secretion pathway protein I